MKNSDTQKGINIIYIVTKCSLFEETSRLCPVRRCGENTT